MEIVDLTKRKFTKFVPHSYLQTNKGDIKWISINGQPTNRLDDDYWMDTVLSIIKVSDEFILVCFDAERNTVDTTVLYRGILE